MYMYICTERMGCRFLILHVIDLRDEERFLGRGAIVNALDLETQGREFEPAPWLLFFGKHFS